MVTLIQFEKSTTAKSADLNYNFSALNNALSGTNSDVSTLNSTVDSLNTAVNTTLPNSIKAAVPAGTIIMWGGTGTPTGYLLCNGDTVSKTTYPDLFNAIGYTYGGSDDNFVLPTLTNSQVPVGTTEPGHYSYDKTDTNGYETAAADVSLSATVKHDEQDFGGHTHSVYAAQIGFLGTGTAENSGSHTHAVSISGNVSYKRHKTLSLRFCIKT